MNPDIGPTMAQKDERYQSSGPAGRVVARTDVGLRRVANQDDFAILDENDGLLLVLCDGMGGHAGGERAAAIATEMLVRGGRGAGASLGKSALRAHEAIRAAASADSNLTGMGTTLVAADVAADGRVRFVNVGDSRIWLHRAGRLEQVSSDHSVVSEMVRRGEISVTEAEEHPRRNVLTMALGVTPSIQPQVGEIVLEDGDLLLLSSDGLHGMIDDRSIARILQADWELAARTDALVDAALDAGGKDNVTVVLLEYSGGGRMPASAQALPGTSKWMLVPRALAALLLFLTILESSGPDQPDLLDPGVELEIVPDSVVQPTPGESTVNDPTVENPVESPADSAASDSNEIRRQLPWGDTNAPTAR